MNFGLFGNMGTVRNRQVYVLEKSLVSLGDQLSTVCKREVSMF